MSVATCRLGELLSTHSPDLSIRSTRRGDMSMDGAGFDTSTRCVDVLETSVRTPTVFRRVTPLVTSFSPWRFGSEH